MIDARTQVLSAIATALGASDRALTQPAPMTISASGADPVQLADAFFSELAALGGWASVVRNRAECSAAIAKYLREREVKKIAVQSSTRAQEIARLLGGFDVVRAAACSKRDLERVDCALLDGRALLADTGSVIVLLNSGADRVLPYLPRTCVIVSDTLALHATLTDEATACIDDAARKGDRGEALIITGPSRTADIEKTLVLGAHGPQAVAVFIMEV